MTLIFWDVNAGTAIVQAPGTLDSLIAVAMSNIIGDWTVWGVILLITIGIILAMLRMDGYASAMIMYVFLTIFGGPKIGVLDSPVFNVVWWFATLVGAVFIVIAMLKVPGGDLR